MRCKDVESTWKILFFCFFLQQACSVYAMQGRREHMEDDFIFFLFFICKQACSVYAMQGRREYMEDDFSIHFPPPPRDPTGEGGGGEGECDSVGERGEEPALFGVFDGHGGARVSQYASKHLLGMYPPPHMHYACILLLI